MEVLKDGTFTHSIDSETLARGLRPSKRAARNSNYLIECHGAVGIDKVLQVIDDLELSRVDTTLTIFDTFPYPQIFVLPNLILVCGSDMVYEYDGSSLNAVLGPVAVGNLWSLINLHDFVYMSNGVVSAIRVPTSGVFELVTDQPVAEAMCNFNGQIMVGGVLV
jgi:hypothetical protein